MRQRLYLFLFFLLYWAAPAFAQDRLLTDFNDLRLQRQRTAMIVLGGWAVGNMASGAALRGRRSGPDRYFHEMNIYWNAVNLGIAAFGYFSAAGTDPGSLDLFGSTNQHYNFQKVLLLNAGLDVGYMLGGLYLTERAKNRPEQYDRLTGFGRSIILQGAFLFAFDLANYFIQAGQNDELRLLLGSTGNGVGLIYQF